MLESNKIGIIGIRGLPARYGAFDSFVQQLVTSEAARKKNIIFYIACDFHYKKIFYKKNNVVRIFFYQGKGFLILLSYFVNIIFMLFSGVKYFYFFGYGSAIFFPLIKLFRCKVICNPDGIEWKRPVGRLKKFYFKFCQKILHTSDVIIFDSFFIKKYYKINYRIDGFVAYYPSVFEGLPVIVNKKKIDRFYILGRLLEENNVEIIVKSFINNSINKKLFIIGPLNSYFEKKILPIIKECKNIVYLGPIYDQNKLFKICSLCNYYIHGHSVGGTNPTLIEAISLKKKIIAFKSYFNREILGDKAIYFKSKDDLDEILKLNKYTFLGEVNYKDIFKSNFINEFYLSFVFYQ
jgi:rhamnosyltransferase